MIQYPEIKPQKCIRNPRCGTVLTALWMVLMITRASAYHGGLDHVFGDVKQGIFGSGGITEANAAAIVDGMHANLKCNGVRVPINLDSPNPVALPPSYSKIIERARLHKMAIYANPMFTGNHHLSDIQYADKIIAFANRYKPDYLGCFNEFGMAPERYVSITAKVKAGLNYNPVMVGPDAQHVDSTRKIISVPAVRNSFAVIASHNADGDLGATEDNWNMLRSMAGKPVWASENPRSWSEAAGGQEIGVKSAINAKVIGLVLYNAFPSCINAGGKLTSKGEEIANSIGERE